MLRFRKIAGGLRKTTAIAGVAVLASAVAFSPVLAATAPFKDMKGHWANESVQLLRERGVVSGFPDGTYKPGNSVSKAEFFTMLNKVMGYTATQTPLFTDVSPKNWFYSEVAKAIAAGYIQGEYRDGGALQPTAAVTRQEAASMIMKALKLQGSNQLSALNEAKFKDGVQIEQWRKSAVDAMLANDIMGGFPDQTFKPKDKVTRAQIAAIMNRIYEFKGGGGSKAATTPQGTGITSLLPINPITVMQYQTVTSLVPKTVTVKYGNGYQAAVSVTWDPISTNELGKHVIKGKVSGSSLQAELIVFVVSSTAQDGGNSGGTGGTGTGNTGGGGSNIPSPPIPTVPDGQAIGNVNVSFSTLMSTIHITVGNHVTSVKANGIKMHYEGNNTYSLATAGLKLGDKITIVAYDIQGKVLQKYETTVQQTNN